MDVMMCSGIVIAVGAGVAGACHPVGALVGVIVGVIPFMTFVPVVQPVYLDLNSLVITSLHNQTQWGNAWPTTAERN
jgi:hypothetical protein